VFLVAKQPSYKKRCICPRSTSDDRDTIVWRVYTCSSRSRPVHHRHYVEPSSVYTERQSN